MPYTYRTLLFPFLFVPLSAWSVLAVTVEVSHQTCSYGNGGVQAAVSGGTPPYTYLWNTGATDSYLSGMPAGTYSVTVTDALSDQATAQGEVLSLPYDLVGIISGVPWCSSPRNAFEDPNVSGMQNMWTVNGMPTTLSGGGFIQFDTEPWATVYTYPVDDGNGCTGTVTGTNGPQIVGWPGLLITGVEPSCDNADIGAIHVVAAADPDPTSPFGPYVNIVRLDGPPVYQAYEVNPGQLTVDFTDLPPGEYAVHWWLGVTAEELDPGVCSYDSLFVNVPDLGSTCGSVSGRSYFDLDGDCVQDAEEVGVPYSPLLIQPGNEVVLTDAFGNFQFPLVNGSYTLEQTDPTLVPICPVDQPVSITVNTDNTYIELANGSSEPLDLAVSLAGTLFRPGFNSQYHLWVGNTSPAPSGPVTVTLELDPTLTYLTANYPPAVAGNSLTWNLPALSSFQSVSIHLSVNVPVGTPLGTALSTTALVTNTLTDAVPANDSYTDVDEVVGSYDPNDKRALTSSRASDEHYIINEDEHIDYTIRFQNTGTFLAEFVVITDTIPEELDMLSFEQGVASHPFTVSFKPGRVIEWRFDGIMLPDSTSDEPGSHGLVKFRMKPVLPLLPGTLLENIANIYFDFNPPVITEPSVLVAEFSTGVIGTDNAALELSPVPVSDRLNLTATTEIRSVRIIATDGREVGQRSIQATSGAIDVSMLRAGAYLLVATMSDGSAARKRFIKQ